ncbi:MAG: M56 family metallopeptidase [Cellvibrio sp.]|nr:M56 family metallopeptidase [Cellvibrio sp.]
MKGPDLISILLGGFIKPLMLIGVIAFLFLLLRNRSAALKHFCLLMGMISLLILPVSAYLIPDMTWEFPLSDLMFQSMPFIWQEYLLKTSHIPVEPLWWQSILMVYLLVSTSIIFYLIMSFIQLWKIYARAKPVKDIETRELVNEIRALLGIKRRIKLVSSQEIDSPCVWGIIHPRVLIPQSSQEWSYEQKVSVFMHELGHVHRYDALSLFIVKISCAVFWFLPPVWWFAKKMARDSEMACDDLIYRLQDKQVQYAEHLLQIANHSTSGSGVVVSMSGDGIAGHSEIYQRIMAILDNKKPRQAVEPESVQYPLIIGLLLVIALGTLNHISLNTVIQSHESSSVFNWSWAKITESKNQNANILEAENTLLSVDEFQSQAKPVLITGDMPEVEKVEYGISEEYKADLEIDKSSFQKEELIDSTIASKNNSVYRSLKVSQPLYPDAALKKGLTGFVKITFDLDAAGVPINIHITESQPSGVFDESVIQSIKNSRFEWLEKNYSHSAIQQHFVFQLDTRRKR